MGKKLFTIIFALFILHSLALIGFLAYGFATQRFDADKRAQYLATWQGEKLVPPPEVVEVVEEKETPQQASARIAASEVERETTIRQTQRDIELARAMQITVAEARDKILKDLKRLQIEQTVFDAKVEEYNQKAQEEEFRKALNIYAKMKPKVVKADFMKMTDEQVVRFLTEMKTSTATKILEQFKSPPEQEKRLRVLEILKEHKQIKLSTKDHKAKTS